MNPRDEFLPRLVSHLRSGAIHEISGPSTGRVAWSATRLRIARNRDDEMELQIQIATRLRSGLATASPWGRCGWTIEDLLELRDEAEEKDVVSTGMDAIAPGRDEIVDTVASLVNGGAVHLAGVTYVLDDGTISVMRDGSLVRPDPVLHPADDWIVRNLA